MKRKIVQQGKSSMNISIPNAWIKRHGVEKGDEVDIEEKEDNLVISSGKSASYEEKVLDVRGLDKVSIKWHLLSLYCSGYDSLKVIFGDHAQIDNIQTFISELMGFSIMEQRENYCIIRSISQPVEEEFEPSLRRIFQVTLSISESTLDALKKKDKKAFRPILSMEKTCNSISYFCIRLLNKKGYGPIYKTTYVNNLINRLENISDTYGKMMAEIKEKDLDIDLSDDVLDVFKKTNGLLRSFYECFYSEDDEKLKEVSDELESDHDKMMELLAGSNEIERRVIHFLILIRNHIGESLISLLALSPNEDEKKKSK